MKADIIGSTPVFQPVSLTITFESLEEIALMFLRVDMSKHTVMEAYRSDPWYASELVNLADNGNVHEAFVAMDKLLKEEGVRVRANKG